MELKEGMYVRTLKGIAKIIGRVLEPDNYYFQCWVTDRFLCICDDTEYLCDSDILKTSYNIIDLIETGDYVNGFLVEEVQKVPNEEIGKVVVTDSSNCDCWEGAPFEYWNEDIKTIVTKEQFESMQYRLGD